jgi:hypothetical protein
VSRPDEEMVPQFVVHLEGVLAVNCFVEFS